MKPGSNIDITGLLNRWSEGDQSVEEKLWPIVFRELKRLANYQLAKERPDHTLQAAALVNEAYTRMVDWDHARWESRAHFFAMSARMMRQILVDHARSRNRQKRPTNRDRVTLDDVVVVCNKKPEELLALDDALTRLATIHPRKSAVVELRFFGGLSIEEIAEVLKVSRLTVIRDWNFARAWLRATITGEQLGSGDPA